MNMPLLFQCLQFLNYDYLPKLTGNGDVDESTLVQQRSYHRLDVFSGVDNDYHVRLGLSTIYLNTSITY